MHKQQRRMTGRRFTLIEIAVAMSIFALLMLILMQIFSATQNVWRTSSGKTDTYESTRVVLDLLGNGLESAIRTNSSTGEKFYYSKTNSELWFPTMTATRLGSNTISGEAEYYFKLDIPSGQTLGTLKFGYAKDTSVDTSTNLDFRTNTNARSTLDTGTGTTNLIPMLENVYEFKIDAFSKDSTGQLQYLSSSTITELPSAVIVTLKVLDNDERTKTRFNAASDADREALLRTFRRIIYVNATN